MAKVDAAKIISQLEKEMSKLNTTAKEVDQTLDRTNKELQENLKVQVEMAKATKATARGMKKVAQIDKEHKRTLEAKQKVDKQRLRLQKDLTQVNDKQRKAVQALKVEQQRRNKLAKQEAQLMNKNLGAYERMNVKIKQMTERYRNLVVAEGKETRESKRLQKQIMMLTKTRDKANMSLGMHQHKVGQYTKVVGKLSSALGKLGLAFGAFMIIRDAFNVVKNFDQAQANLASVLGVTRDEMSKLTEQAKELGATTKFTAAQVSELQLEYAKLGFTQTQIEGMTEATLELAAAAGTELGNAAEIVGGTMRGFGLDTSQTQRVVDVMAKSFSSSSLDIEKFKTAMAAVAPVANGAGVSIERTTALIGTLTDRGIDASSAGTGLRNMFLAATKEGITFDQAIERIQNSTDKTAASLDLFGKRGATLGVILANNMASVEGLTGTLENAAGAAGEMAEKQLDTLSGALDLLRSAWEGYILGVDGASGASEKLKNIIKFLADNLDTILDTIFTVVTLWGSYKIAVKAATAANKLFGTSMPTNAIGIAAAALAGMVVVVMDLVNQFGKFEDASEALEDVTDRVNEKLAEEKVELQLLGRELLANKDNMEARGRVIDKINAKYGTTLKNLSDETAMVQQLSAAYQQIVQDMSKKIRLEVLMEKIKEAESELFDLKKEAEDFGVFDITNTDAWFGGARLIELEDEVIPALYAEFTKLSQEVGKTEHGMKTTSGLLEDRFNRVKDSISGVKKELEELASEGLADDSFVDDYYFFPEPEDAKKTMDIIIETGDEINEAYSKIIERQKAIEHLEKSIREAIVTTTQIFIINQKKRLAAIDAEIEAKKKDFEESKSREQQLIDLAKEKGLDATESINAEREAQKKALLEQRKLENEKQRVAALIAGLELLASKVQAGEGNPIQSIRRDILSLKNFINGAFSGGGSAAGAASGALGSYAEGGYTGDGGKYQTAGVVHKGEFVIDKETTAAMGLQGANMESFRNMMSMSALNGLNNPIKKANETNEVVEVLKEVKKEIQKEKTDISEMAFNAMIGALQHTNKKGTKYYFPKSKR
jgi:predicted XRE-type DNA-binding protein/Arc/MetJ-type ribon-helix-helix transcriptional regulator